MGAIVETNLQINNQVTRIYDKIVRMRSEMYELEESFGMSHELTVTKSQELDAVINEYMIQKFRVSMQLAS